MRNLVVNAIAGLSLATLLIGSAAANDASAYQTPQMSSGNIAEQNALERDAADRRLHRAAEGVIVSRGDATQVPSRQDQAAAVDENTPWLRRSPAGASVIEPASPNGQSAATSSSRD